MKKVLIGALLSAVSLTGFTTAQAAMIVADATLDYEQEIDPSNATASTASGIASFVFDTDTGTVSLTATITGITIEDITFDSGGLSFAQAGPAHLHNAPVGINGAIVLPFNDPSFFTATADGFQVAAADVAFDAILVSQLVAGDLYLNIHTQDYPSGEIRGQLMVDPATVPEPGSIALLSGLLALLVRRRRGDAVA